MEVKKKKLWREIEKMVKGSKKLLKGSKKILKRSQTNAEGKVTPQGHRRSSHNGFS